MEKIKYKNETIKRRFYKDFNNSRGYSDKSILCFKKAIWLWEEFTNDDDFMHFSKTKAENFKNWLKKRKKTTTEDYISLSYCYDVLRHIRLFFGWLSEQSGYKSKINKEAIEYLNLTRGEIKIATQPKSKKIPSVEEIKVVIEGIEGKNEIEMRDKALISLILMTGARISAVKSLPIKSFDREKMILEQDPQMGVETKNSKRITTSLITISYLEPKKYFLDWYDYLVNQKMFKGNDPIFPATKIEYGQDNNLGYFNTEKVEPVFWKNSTSIRKIFDKRFKNADIPYYHPHSLRHLLVKEIRKIPLTEEQKKALSQNFGHSNVGTTFGSYGYGAIEDDIQVEIINEIDFTGQKTKHVSLSLDDLRQILKEKDND